VKVAGARLHLLEQLHIRYRNDGWSAKTFDGLNFAAA